MVSIPFLKIRWEYVEMAQRTDEGVGVPIYKICRGIYRGPNLCRDEDFCNLSRLKHL